MAKRSLGPLLLLVAIGAVACLVGMDSAYAQGVGGSITGVVEDPSRAVIAGAKVTATDQSTNLTQETQTNEQGMFTFPNLRVGRYQVSAELSGFRRLVLANVVVEVGQVARLNMRLELGEIIQQVVISETIQTLVNTETAELKTTVDRRQILNLPLPTRNPMDLARLMPGVTTPAESSTSFVHGLRGNATNILQDGINVADNFVKTSAFFAISAPTVENTGEFTVSVGTLGSASGFGAAQVSIVTPRGENALHGSAYWFHRNDILNANDFYANLRGDPKPIQRQNRFGVRAGGPVYIPGLFNGKDKTWLFGYYEGFREPRSVVRNRTVMTPSARLGNFQWRANCTTATCPAGITPGQLMSINLLSGIGNATAINPVTMDLYNQVVPASNNTDAGDGLNTAGFSFNSPGKARTDRWALRADHKLTSSHTVEAVFNRATFDTSPDFLNGIEPPFPDTQGGGQRSVREQFVVALHSTFGPNKTNEVRFGFNRAPVQFAIDQTFPRGFRMDFLGMTDPENIFNNLPQGRNTPVRQINETFSWSKGRHQFRFGGEWRQISAFSFFDNGILPLLCVNPHASTNCLTGTSANATGIDSADFTALGGISSTDLGTARNVFSALTGWMHSTRQAFNTTSPTSGFVPGADRIQDPIQTFWSVYAQDSLKVWSNLTFQFGVRWEYHGVFDFRNGTALQPRNGVDGLWGPAGPGNLFNPGVLKGVTPTLLDLAGGRNGRPFYNKDLNNFAPFFGFAYDPFKSGKTSIRGGISMSYMQDGFTFFTNGISVNPGLQQIAVTASTSTVQPQVTPAGFTVPTPTFALPISDQANFTISSANDLVAFDANLKTPYVIQWSFGIEREVWKRTAIEVRYVGNHAVKQLRGVDLNEIDIVNNGFLQEFLSAQNNLNLCSANRVACTGSTTGALRFNNAGVAGQVNTPILDKFFTGVSASSGYQSGTLITFLNQNEVIGMANTLRKVSTYRANMFNPALFPLNFFVVDPYADEVRWLNNGGFSTYHGLEVEVRRKFARGLFLQANYTFSKTLTDFAFLTSQSEAQPYFTLRNQGLDKARANFDITHQFKGNFAYELPFGRGQWLGGNVAPWLNKFIGGWSVNGLVIWQNGRPLALITNRDIFGGSIARDSFPVQLQGATLEELKAALGVFRDNGAVFYIDPNSKFLIVTRDAAGKVTNSRINPAFLTAPPPGQFGNIPFKFADIPARFFNTDLSVIKRTGLGFSETANIEFRLEMFNAFNNANFTGGGLPFVDIFASDAGRFTDTVDTTRGGDTKARIIQIALRFNW